MIRVGILGAGHIGEKMANTIPQMDQNRVQLVAVASRSLDKATAFAGTWHIPKAYGSYEDMAADPDIDLIYVATPHSHHYEHARLCLSHGKHVLCEKAFTVNAKQAKELCAISEAKGLLLAEAIWTRYLPSRELINAVIRSGQIGEVRMVLSSLSWNMEDKERITNPHLAGGALLDVGVYCINFASMVLGDDIAQVDTQAVMMPTGVDASEVITLQYASGAMAVLTCSAVSMGDRGCLIQGSKGFITVDVVSNPMDVRVHVPGPDGMQVTRIGIPPQITGFEYQVAACLDAIEQGKAEPAQMPHQETVRIMELMDALRARWGMVYPMEV